MSIAGDFTPSLRSGLPLKKNDDLSTRLDRNSPNPLLLKLLNHLVRFEDGSFRRVPSKDSLLESTTYPCLIVAAKMSEWVWECPLAENLGLR